MSSSKKFVVQDSTKNCIHAPKETMNSEESSRASKNDEDHKGMMTVFNLCYMQHAIVDSERETHILEDTNHKSLGQLGLSSLKTGTKRKALEIEEQEEAIIVAQGLPEANPQVQQQGLFYGNYAPPNLPPVPSLRKLIEICIKPFEKQLTNRQIVM